MSASRLPGDRTLCVIVFAATLVFAFAFAYPRQWTRGLLINDEMWNANLARSLFEGRGFVSDMLFALQFGQADGFPVAEAFKQSGYPLLVAAAWTVTGVDVRTSVAIAIVGFALAASLVFALFRAFGCGRRLALAAAIMFAGSPALVGNLTAALPESWFVAAFLAAVLAGLRSGLSGPVLSGALLVAAILIKGHGIIYLPLFAGLFALGKSQRLLRVGAFGLTIVAGSVLAVVVLPAGSVGLFGSGGNYSSAFLVEVEGIDTMTLSDVVEPPNAREVILTRPFDYAVKYAKMVSRTKVILDALGEPVLTGLSFPLFIAVMVLTPFSLLSGLERIRPRLRVADDNGVASLTAVAWLWSLVSVTLVFFWAIYPTGRFWMHVYPLMGLLVAGLLRRLFSESIQLRPTARMLLWAFAAYALLYPPVFSLWQAYRAPFAHIGRSQSSRFFDFDVLATELRAHLPDDAVVITDLPFEVNWHTGMRTIVFPYEREGFLMAVDKYGADAVLEHPALYRDWPELEDRFEVVGTDNGRLWLRRDGDQPR